ncbi:MAG: GNAT family N-acetyltransferase [Myxococcales bacterium]|nr:GNAT family N-acetyltransferase [Myxococcales bacterium]
MDAEEESPVLLQTERLVLTLLPPSAAKRVLGFQADNRAHLSGWSPPFPPGYFNEEYWIWRLDQNRAEYLEDRSCRLQITSADQPDGPVIGQISFTQYSRGPHQSCNLGYSIDHRHQGRGLMKEGLTAALELAFGRLAFHRVAANYMPTNERSGRLLRSLGFVVEGYARDYLYLAGAWRDHVLTSLHNPDPSPPGVRAFATPGVQR